MPVYLAAGTIAATAGRAFDLCKHKGGFTSENDPTAWLGPDADWDERRYFDWCYLVLEVQDSIDRCVALGDPVSAEIREILAQALRGKAAAREKLP